jgi:RNA polymerase subunit RPABC4/transcription elongation factor Spt4
MICQNCGKEFRGNTKYCWPCGQKLGGNPAATHSKASTKRCTYCHSTIAKDAFYCPVCHKIASVEVSDAVRQTETKNAGSFALGFFLAWQLGLIAFLIIRSVGAPETARGAKWGFIVSWIIIGAVLSIFLPICLYLGEADPYFWSELSNLSEAGIY